MMHMVMHVKHTGAKGTHHHSKIEKHVHHHVHHRPHHHAHSVKQEPSKEPSKNQEKKHSPKHMIKGSLPKFTLKKHSDRPLAMKHAHRHAHGAQKVAASKKSAGPDSKKQVTDDSKKEAAKK